MHEKIFSKRQLILLGHKHSIKVDFTVINYIKEEKKTQRGKKILKNRICLCCGSRLEKQVYQTAVMMLDAVVCTNNNCNNFTIMKDCEEIEDIDVQQISTNFPTIKQMTKNLIQSVLYQTGDNRQETAKILGISERTLYRKIKDFGLSKKTN